MNIRAIIILFFSVMILTGCIESGGLDIPGDSRGIDLSNIRSQLEKVGDNTKPPSKMGVPLEDLPSFIQRNQEKGIYLEAYSLRDLPSTVIYWEVRKDPYSRDFEKQRIDSKKGGVMVFDDGNITPWIYNEEDLFRISAHVGLYTFSAWTENPLEIDMTGLYGNHDEIVEAVFQAGVKNALQEDLSSFGK